MPFEFVANAFGDVDRSMLGGCLRCCFGEMGEEGMLANYAAAYARGRVYIFLYFIFCLSFPGYQSRWHVPAALKALCSCSWPGQCFFFLRQININI